MRALKENSLQDMFVLNQFFFQFSGDVIWKILGRISKVRERALKTSLDFYARKRTDMKLLSTFFQLELFFSEEVNMSTKTTSEMSHCKKISNQEDVF